MTKTRIKFLAENDLARSYHLNNSDKIINNQNIEDSNITINDILELYNIHRYVKAGIIDRWCSTKIKKIIATINTYLRNITSDLNLSVIYDNVEESLKEDFWTFFSEYNLPKKIKSDQFSDFIMESQPEVSELLREKKLVNSYDSPIKQYFIQKPHNIILLVKILEINDIYTKPLFLPKSLTRDEVNDMVVKFVDSYRPNLNYLKLLLHMNSYPMINLTDKIRLKIKKKIESETKIFFENNTGIKTGVSLILDPNQKNEVEIKLEDKVLKLSYSLNWLKENLDNATILNNFIHLFCFVDNQMRTTLTSNKNDIKPIEDLFTIRSKNHYKIGWEFQQKEMTAHIQLYTYYDLLNSYDIELEDVIEWFYSEYVVENFNIQNITTHLPKKNLTYLQKCKDIAPEIEGILKKYNLYIEDQEIDLELFELFSNPLLFKECKSLFEKKYIYPNVKDFSRICYYFFSDQCVLHYLENDTHQYKSFFDILTKRPIYIHDYGEHVKQDLEWLKGYGYISFTEDDQIILPDAVKIIIIRDLYNYDVINYLNCTERWKTKINEMIESGFLRYESSLFSQDEQQYFNYYLNKKEFSNSLELRNMYSHGSYSHSDQDSDKHKLNYIIFLTLIIIITIKINDELCENEENI
ncbi:MAG: hypothetical protein OCD02_11180 [Spirochaetaceae bacterium]